MCKKSLIEKNKRNINRVKKLAEKRQELMKKSLDQSLPVLERLKAHFKVHKMGKYASKVSIVPRCVFTGRAKGKFVKLGYPISRIKLRELVSFGMLPGFRKYSS